MCRQGDWWYFESQSTPETRNGNSEDGNKEWNANMAIKLFSKQKEEGLSYQQNPAYIQKRKSHPPFHETEANYSVGSTHCRNPEVQEEKRLVPERERGTRGSGQGHLVKAATTAHSTSLVPAFRHSASGSKSRSCRTRLVATSYCSSSRGANAFSRTSEAWAR